MKGGHIMQQWMEISGTPSTLTGSSSTGPPGGASLPKNGHTAQNEPDGQREFEESGAFFGDTRPGCSHQIPYKLICKARLRRQLHRPAFFPAIHLDAILSHRREEMR